MSSSPSRPSILVFHGPNLNLLGEREPEIYGRITLAEINQRLVSEADARGYDCRTLQSNHEGVLIDGIQEGSRTASGILINAAGYGHTSVALRDALLASGLPVVDIHLTNVFAREIFRHTSLIADVALGVVSGFGADSYSLGLFALLNHLDRGQTGP